MGITGKILYERKTELNMKSKIFLFIAIITGFVLVSFTREASHIRDDFHKAVTSECKLQTIIVSKTYPNNAMTKAYKGLASCTSADFATWPTTKWKYFTEGKTLIESAIKSETSNPEIRYVRLMVQLNAPALVGYSDEISNDLAIFVKELPHYSIDTSWKSTFIDNLKNSNELSTSQINTLKTLKEGIIK